MASYWMSIMYYSAATFNDFVGVNLLHLKLIEHLAYILVFIYISKESSAKHKLSTSVT